MSLTFSNIENINLIPAANFKQVRTSSTKDGKRRGQNTEHLYFVILMNYK